MKCIVKEHFVDKYDYTKVYNKGDVLDWDDQVRITDCVTRGLIAVQEETKPIKKTPGKTTK